MIAILQYANVLSGPLVVAACVLLLLLTVPLILGPVYYNSRSVRHRAVAVTRRGAVTVEVPADYSPPISWAQSLSAGVGFLLTAAFIIALWLLARQAGGVRTYSSEFLVVPVTLLGCGLVYLVRGILHKGRQ
jgi:hypothetical protein